ncbi:hypothetical protein GCM10010446_02680 [Streptomyces enissocaesilis]|uniref:Uncharacterized protein n=1 Tax=Streptomyces enissocaesilis TaxID=332589 RepID=A0ABP6J5V9_9ACTN
MTGARTGRSPRVDAGGGRGRPGALRVRELPGRRDDRDAVLSGSVSSLSSRDEKFPHPSPTGPTIRTVGRGGSSPDGFAPSARL